MSLPRLAFLPLLAAALAPGLLRADVKLPAIFGDHMVLQRDGVVPVWGTAEPGEGVTVTAGAATGSATAGPDGKWTVKLSGLAASAQPLDVTVAGKNQIVLHDVLVGDVWVCSGQSNMEFGIGNDASAAEEIPKADHPEIRLFMVIKKILPVPAADLVAPPEGATNGRWIVCTPDTVKQNGWGGFTAVGYFFGRDVAAFTHAPVGLIDTCWGGTPAQAWTSLEALQAVPALKNYAGEAAKRAQNHEKEDQDYQTVVLPKWKADVEQWKVANKDKWDAYQADLQKYNDAVKTPPAAGTPAPAKPKDPTPPAPKDPAFNPNAASVLYNAMIAPLVPYGIKGAIWYQGESNAGRPLEYATLLPTMIGDWRARWGQGDFPFLIVQLANYLAHKPDPSESNWAVLRDSQAKTAAMPHNGLALAIDLGEYADIHPKDKDDVGARLALAARKIAYGDDAAVFSGPTYSGQTVEGDKIRLAFGNAGSGLAIGVPPPHFHPGQPRSVAPALKDFAIAGADGKYVWADAVIDGNTVVVSSPQVPQPASVRYDWADNPEGNLYNKEGLPAVPFRTDTALVGEATPAPPPAAPAPAPVPAK